jgi:glycine cleavage system H protein
MSKTYFTADHEWIRVDGSTATVGITNYAQEQLGDLVFVDLPKVGKSITKGGACVVVESVKAASDVYAPADGVVTAINQALNANPAIVNSAPESDGWLWQMTLSNAAQLDSMMDEAAYKAMVA